MVHFLVAHQGWKLNEKFSDLREKTGSSYRTEGHNAAQRPVKGSEDTPPALSASCLESNVNSRADMSFRKPEVGGGEIAGREKKKKRRERRSKKEDEGSKAHTTHQIMHPTVIPIHLPVFRKLSRQHCSLQPLGFFHYSTELVRQAKWNKGQWSGLLYVCRHSELQTDSLYFVFASA